MKNFKAKIAKQTLKSLITSNWESISIDMISKKLKLNKRYVNNNFKNKNDLLKNINQYFDDLILKSVKSIDKSTPNDMLFEILMLRFDLLTHNRKSILKIFEIFKHQPKIFILLLPSFLNSVSIMAKKAQINTFGITGSIKLKSILVIYFSTFLTWINDESTSLDKTMTTLDNYLNRCKNILNF